MKPLSQYADEKLQLVQPSIWKRVYELRTPDSVLMTMSSPKLFSTLTNVEGFGEKWEIYKPRWWRSGIEIRKQGNQLPIAKFLRKSFRNSGVFELPMGERIHYRCNTWKRTHELLGDHQQLLVMLKSKVSFKPTVNIAIEKQSPILDKYPWIVMVVFRSILEQRQSAAG